MGIFLFWGAILSAFLLFIVSGKLIKELINKNYDIAHLYIAGGILSGFIMYVILVLCGR
ncbi:hypothetical protein HNQ94_000110 [Salirhabdus euzebyi]|uniref:Uncharacterized protein n=1 Tax=Salirhabdus euzebyi TaxID=394506 RepID=A0A841PSA4_9BACI|nr:hypothetical protein [Salirhabdus euzebyi]MBB6451689.1 hypothetical protein [Salirhabdus euzebyi]